MSLEPTDRKIVLGLDRGQIQGVIQFRLRLGKILTLVLLVILFGQEKAEIKRFGDYIIQRMANIMKKQPLPPEPSLPRFRRRIHVIHPTKASLLAQTRPETPAPNRMPHPPTRWSF